MVHFTFFGDHFLRSRCPLPSLQELGDESSSQPSRPRVELNPYVPAVAAAALVFGRKLIGAMSNDVQWVYMETLLLIACSYPQFLKFYEHSDPGIAYVNIGYK